MRRFQSPQLHVDVKQMSSLSPSLPHPRCCLCKSGFHRGARRLTSPALPRLHGDLEISPEFSRRAATAVFLSFRLLQVYHRAFSPPI